MSTAEGSRADAPDSELLLRRVLDLVNDAPRMPLSSTIRVERDEVVSLLDEAVERLPDELREARWLLREREEYLAKAEREAEEILGVARERAERIVQRSELVREAQRTARRILEEANDEARRLRHEAEDYCDQKLAQFEIVLERTTKTVKAGRAKLQVTTLPEGRHGVLGDDDGLGTGEVFFDQDN